MQRFLKNEKTFLQVVFSIFCLLAVLPVFAGGKKSFSAGDTERQGSVVIKSFDTSRQKAPLRVGSLNGPTGIPVAYMYENPPNIGGSAVTFESFASPSALLPKMLKGEIDIGFLPVNVAAKVYTSSDGALVTAGISGNGSISLVTDDPTVRSFADLKGKKVFVAGQGATPEYLFRYLLAENEIKTGLDPNDVSTDFSVETPNIAAELVSGKIHYAVVPEPFGTVVTMKSAHVFKALDFGKEYEKINGSGSTYPLTLLVVRKAFANEHPDEVRAFLAEYKISVSWTLANPEKAGFLVQKYTLGLQAPVVAKAIPACNFVCIDAQTARPAIERLLGIFLKFSPEAIGGKLPGDGFYFR